MVTKEEIGKCRASSMSRFDEVVTHFIDKLNQTISDIYIVSDGYAAQFHSRFVFNFLIFFQNDAFLE